MNSRTSFWIKVDCIAVRNWGIVHIQVSVDVDIYARGH